MELPSRPSFRVSYQERNQETYPEVLNFIRNTCTRTGLAVSAYLDRKHYPTGTSPDPEQLRRLCLKRHSALPAWNYTIAPM